MKNSSKTKPTKFVPVKNYKDKYVHLIGQDAALNAAKKTETNKNYGFGELAFKYGQSCSNVMSCRISTLSQ